MAQPQLSPAAPAREAAGRRRTARVDGIRSISIDHEPGRVGTKQESTNSAVAGLASALGVSCEYRPDRDVERRRGYCIGNDK
jgi:hypothetical protein